MTISNKKKMERSASRRKRAKGGILVCQNRKCDKLLKDTTNDFLCNDCRKEADERNKRIADLRRIKNARRKE